MNGLRFSEEVARKLERLYLTKDVVAQRSETIKQLSLCQAERVLDVGCGPGFLCESMAEVVGRYGAVIGIDISADLIELCKRRNPPKWLSYRIEDATQLPQPDGSFDAVVCTQVAEYVQDVDRALSEAFRVVKLGGRAIFCCNRLGCGRLALGNPRSHGIGFEVLGTALCPSTFTQVTAQSFGRCRLPVQWRVRFSNPQSPMGR